MHKEKEIEKITLTDLQKRKLNKFYIAVYVVTKNIKIRTETCITQKELYIFYGLNIMGNREDIVDLIKQIVEPNDVILFKASNGMKFFEIAGKIKQTI